MAALPLLTPDADELDVVQRRTTRATTIVVLAAAAAAAAAALSAPWLALLPLAFVLGWLNLAGA